MEEIFEHLKRAITPAQERTATAMDGISDRMADAAAASYIASVAEDAGFEESAHPREAKGGKGGGRFRTSGKTIEKEDIKEKKPFNIPNILESLADDLENGSSWEDVAETLYETGWIPYVSTDKAKSVMEWTLAERRGKGDEKIEKEDSIDDKVDFSSVMKDGKVVPYKDLPEEMRKQIDKRTKELEKKSFAELGNMTSTEEGMKTILEKAKNGDFIDFYAIGMAYQNKLVSLPEPSFESP